ncbi:MAG: hypothetical protein KGD68_08565, partial [Candidatus Lokiarchaeota archaeon]|nr:hypothetical protein [Candidatus Lokiarchaeota archaeon]
MYEELELRALKLLAKNFEYNQALHMEADQMATLLDVKKKDIQPVLRALGDAKLANLYEEGDKIKLAKITWIGLNEIGDQLKNDLMVPMRNFATTGKLDAAAIGKAWST